MNPPEEPSCGINPDKNGRKQIFYMTLEALRDEINQLKDGTILFISFTDEET